MKKEASRQRKLHLGNNLELLASLPDGSVDLIYLDPPFNSGRAYETVLPNKRESEGRIGEQSFSDKWVWTELTAEDHANLHGETLGQIARLIEALVKTTKKRSTAAYLVSMAPRIFHAVRTLSATGSIYVHCDPAASHYLKIILDAICGPENFRNEIIWRRTHAHSSSKRYGPVHDVILFYSKSSAYYWNTVYTAYRPEYLEKHFRNNDEAGDYQLITCTAPGDRTGTRAHYEWRGQWPPPGRHWAWQKEKMEEFENDGRLIHSSTGVPRLKRYVSDGQGVPLQDVWLDLPRLDAHSDERVGFETQKPLSLLERILTSSSKPGDVVLDPFCGSGTTLVMAERMQRSWIGADAALLACSLALGRVRQEVGASPIKLQGFPDSESVASKLLHSDPTTFGVWAAGMLATTPSRDDSEGLMTGLGRTKAKGGAAVQIGSWIGINEHFSPRSLRFRKDQSQRFGYVLAEKGKSGDLVTWIKSHTNLDHIECLEISDLVTLNSVQQGVAQKLAEDIWHH